MHQPGTNLNKTPAEERMPRLCAGPRSVATQSHSPLDSLVRGLASIGDRFFRSRARLRIP